MKINNKLNKHFGFIKVKLTLNNIFITYTDFEGNVLKKKHSGILKFKGSKKKTPYVASGVVKELIKDIKESNLMKDFFILQINNFIRKGVIRSIVSQLQNSNLNNFIYLEYINKKTHNGLRLKKKRRL